MQNNGLLITHHIIKHNFKEYVRIRLKHLPLEDQEFIISESHEHAVRSAMENKFNVVMGYRGWGKSSLFSFAYTLWRAEMWDESTCILSANEVLAMSKLDLIRSAIEFDNPDLAYLCGQGIEGITWNKGEIWIVDKNKFTKDAAGNTIPKVKARIYAKGIYSNYRGLHVHNVMGDDIVTEDTSLTIENRMALEKQFFAAALGMRLNKNRTHIFLIGTPQDPEDLLMKCIADARWNNIIIPVYNEYGMLTCPDLHDEQWVEEQRGIVGETIFRQEYMLEPISVGNDFFGADVLEKSKNHALIFQMEYQKKADEIIAIGVDFAVIEDKKHAESKDTDYFAIAAVCYNRDTGRKRLLCGYQERGLKRTRQLQIVEIWARLFNTDFIGVEKHAFLAWAANDLDEKLPDKIIDTGSKAGKFDKMEGIPSLQVDFELGLWTLPYGDDLTRGVVDILLGQLKALHKANHDDLSDAVLRADKAIRAVKGTEIKYEKKFNLYKQADKMATSLFG